MWESALVWQYSQYNRLFSARLFLHSAALAWLIILSVVLGLAFMILGCTQLGSYYIRLHLAWLVILSDVLGVAYSAVLGRLHSVGCTRLGF